MNLRFRKRPAVSLGASLLVVLALVSCGVNTIPTKDVWFTKHYIIMQDFERNAYRGLSEAGRKSFQDLFWSHRTADAQKTFAARMDYVMKNFRKENSQQPWNTDRGRTYLLNGDPAAIDYDQNIDFATPLPGQTSAARDMSGEDVQANRAEIWTYPYDKYLIKYVFAFVQPTSWRIVQSALTNNRYLGEMENSSKTETFGITDLDGYKKELAALEKKK